MRRILNSLCVGLLLSLTPTGSALANSPADRQSDLIILLLPFWPINGDSEHWVGQAIQQNLLSELDHLPSVRAIAPTTRPSRIDTDDAIKIAQDRGASLMIHGSFHRANDLLRATGQVVDVSSGQNIGTIKATGGDLISVEDELAEQSQRTIRRLQYARTAATRPATTQPQLPPPAVVFSGPIRQGPTAEPQPAYADLPYRILNQDQYEASYRRDYLRYPVAPFGLNGIDPYYFHDRYNAWRCGPAPYVPVYPYPCFPVRPYAISPFSGPVPLPYRRW